ncbi:MAG: UDP-glucose/GDP-mannose dehydrogenase family protein [Candidatus Omnitrophica bacterium]|nr:UDP-glucose/GDP-mannose dehydrogenase family protein [Candidatus Omnitrophota bacterium]
MEICIIGSGHVGLVTGACFADLGNRVVCVDNDRRKLSMLKAGKAPFYEPGLEQLLRHNIAQKRLSFTPSIAEGVRRAQVIFIAVGTPPLPSGEADLTGVEHVVREVACAMKGYRLLVEKSTVPVETGKWIEHTLRSFIRKKVPFDVASNPEFLREGSAVNDFLHPDRVVIGVQSQKAKGILTELYKPFQAPMVVTDVASAELIKHASNAFLATKISFINAVAGLCEQVGADVEKVAHGVGLDRRIGPAFLDAGVGYGGFCLPKDIEAFIRIAEKLGVDFKLLKAVREINETQRRSVVKKVERQLWNLKGKKIGILGLAFKPDTDDMRFAPSLEVIDALLKAGASIRAFDPQAMPEAHRLLDGITFSKNPYELARGCDCLVVITEWNEFKELDLKKVKRLMRQPVIVDGRNLYDPAVMKGLGFRYAAVGRGSS